MDDIALTIDEYAALIGASPRSVRDWAAHMAPLDGGARFERTNPSAVGRARRTVYVPWAEYERLRALAAARRPPKRRRRSRAPEPRP